MLISNTQEIPGKTIVEFHGVVSGSTVRAKHIGRTSCFGPAKPGSFPRTSAGPQYPQVRLLHRKGVVTE